MADVGAVWVQLRAHWVLARSHARAARERARRGRHVLTSAALVVVGLGGALAGGALVGEWCLGLVLMAESGAAVWLGLQRDDRVPLPGRGERTVAQVLEHHRRLP